MGSSSQNETSESANAAQICCLPRNRNCPSLTLGTFPAGHQFHVFVDACRLDNAGEKVERQCRESARESSSMAMVHLPAKLPKLNELLITIDLQFHTKR